MATHQEKLAQSRKLMFRGHADGTVVAVQDIKNRFVRVGARCASLPDRWLGKMLQIFPGGIQAIRVWRSEHVPLSVLKARDKKCRGCVHATILLDGRCYCVCCTCGAWPKAETHEKNKHARYYCPDKRFPAWVGYTLAGTAVGWCKVVPYLFRALWAWIVPKRLGRVNTPSAGDRRS